MALTFIFMPPISYGAVWIINNGGDYFFWYLWIFGIVVILSFMIIWPSFIAPLFNDYVHLGKNFSASEKEKDLRERVENIALRINFPITEIYKVDGSTRSNHSQAYFFGLINKRIVIFDTLIDQCDNEETESILFHELGHWHHMHDK